MGRATSEKNSATFCEIGKDNRNALPLRCLAVKFMKSRRLEAVNRRFIKPCFFFARPKYGGQPVVAIEDFGTKLEE